MTERCLFDTPVGASFLHTFVRLNPLSSHMRAVELLCTCGRHWPPVMFGVDREKLIESLEALRKTVCAYGPDADRCDCKFGISYTGRRNSTEQTGCPELRQAILILRGREDEVLTLHPQR